MCAVGDGKFVSQDNSQFRLLSQPNDRPFEIAAEDSARRASLQDAETDEHCCENDEQLLSNTSSRFTDAIIPGTEPLDNNKSRRLLQPNNSLLENATEDSARRALLKDADVVTEEHCSERNKQLLGNSSSRLADDIIPSTKPHDYDYARDSLKSSDQYDLKSPATGSRLGNDVIPSTKPRDYDYEPDSLKSSDQYDLKSPATGSRLSDDVIPSTEPHDYYYEPDSLKSSARYDSKIPATVLNDEHDLGKHLPTSESRDLSEQCECLFRTPRCSISVFVYTGDLLWEKVDAIVNPANIHLIHGGGAAKAIATAAGRQLKDECEQYIRQKGQLNVTEVMHTSAGNLRPNILHVIHAAGCIARACQDQGKLLADLRTTFYNCLQCANDVLKVRSVSFPAIGTGWYDV